MSLKNYHFRIFGKYRKLKRKKNESSIFHPKDNLCLTILAYFLPLFSMDNGLLFVW